MRNAVYEFGTYDKYGNLNSKYFLAMIILIFFITYIISFLFIDFIKIAIYENEFISFKQLINNLIINFKSTYFFFNKKGFIAVVNYNKISILFSILSVAFYIYKTFYKKIEQRKLRNFGLENYYLYKKLKGGYIYKVVAGEVMEYDKFLKQFDNMTQRNKMGSCEIQRIDKIGVKVKFKYATPTIKDLAHPKINNFMKENKLFLGFEGGFEKKSVPLWIDFKELPHAFALLGSSGGGKSNTLNHILFSIFYNFHLVHDFTFIDFKGGVEAQPYKQLEDKYKTNKITVFSSSRLELYKMLVRMDIVNKSRQKYLISKNKKKFIDKFIYIFFDEISEILDYKSSSKQSKIIQDKTKEIIESLFRTSRSSGFKLFYATQIFTSIGSGLTNSIKNNTIFRVLHKTESTEGIYSVIEQEPLQERGINVKEFKIGEMIIKNENKYYNIRSLFIKDNFIESIKIKNTNKDISFDKEMDDFIKATINEYVFENGVYSKGECLNDFNIK